MAGLIDVSCLIFRLFCFRLSEIATTIRRGYHYLGRGKLISLIAPATSLFLQLFCSHSINQQCLDAILRVLLLVMLKLDRSGDVLVSLELRLGFVMKVSFRSDVSEKM
jgi:hypothetical protein